MKIFEANQRVTRHRIFSVVVMVISGIFFILAALKGIYFSVAGDASGFSVISQTVQRLVYQVYEKTRFLSLIWEWAPVINPQTLNTSGNYGFLFIALCGVIGRVIWDCAANLSGRIARTIQRVEELGWERELMGHRDQSVDSKLDVLQINIELDQKDQWYKRPVGQVFLGVAIAVFAQWANLRFGLLK